MKFGHFVYIPRDLHTQYTIWQKHLDEDIACDAVETTQNINEMSPLVFKSTNECEHDNTLVCFLK